MAKLHPETLCVQAGYRPGNGEPRQLPIVQSTTFKHDNGEDIGRLVTMEKAGYMYSGLKNPTCDAVAAKICALEGGTAAMLTSSGQSANFLAIFNIAGNGDHIVACTSIYSSTYKLLSVSMKRMGIETTFVSPDCTEEELNAAFKPNTKVVFGETILNTTLDVLDIEKFAKAAHDHGVPLIADNTLATPVNCRPIMWGADIVTHSTTEYMDGHGSTVGGCIVDGGRFNWTANADKFPGLSTPDENNNGNVYTRRFGLAGAFIAKCTAGLMGDFGCSQSPQNAYYVNLGLETLPLRVNRQCANARAVATLLKSHEKVSWVKFPGFEDDKDYAVAQKYMPNGSCPIVSFTLKGGRRSGEIFTNLLRLTSVNAYAVDTRTTCLHPASSIFAHLTDEELENKGISANLIRISYGLENINDILADIKQALDRVVDVDLKLVD